VTPPQTFVGIDVAKRQLDIALRPAGEARSVKNDSPGIDELMQRLKGLQPTLIVLEATGGYEAPLVWALAAAQLPFHVANPRQVRDFAKGTGHLAKTDSIDAAVLAHFAEVVRPKPKPLASEATRALNGLVVRRRQLVDMLSAEENRRDNAPTEAVQASLRAHIRWLEQCLADLDHDLGEAIRSDPEWREDERILRSAKGVGPVFTTSALGGLPELGSLTGKQISSLVGVAPLNRDSGGFHGKRRVWGGRGSIRAVLYMSTLVATRHNPVIRSLYQRLLAAGKIKKVALVACMRKLLTILNAMMRDRRPWQDWPISHPS
jgi:transposase